MAQFRKRPDAVIEAEIAEYEHHIETLEGRMLCRKGDFIVTGVAGERYPVKKEIFEATYISADQTFVEVCCDFDGVLNQYNSGWTSADDIPDEPVNGAFVALYGWLEAGLTVAVYSARSAEPGGIQAIRRWISHYDEKHRIDYDISPDVEILVEQLFFPFFKPAAKVYLDDRGIRFNGTFPTVDDITQFKTWYGK